MSLLEVRKITARVMIVDDEVANVQLLKRMLGFAGCTDCPATTDSREALDLCKTTRPDVILLDLNMPHLSGIDLLGLFAEHSPCRISMPILVLTADGTRETRHAALQAGASDFLTKPFDALELVLRLGNHLQSRDLFLKVVENNELLESRVKERTHDLEEAQGEIIDRLAVATEMRDDETGDHVERVATMTAQIAEALGMSLSEIDLLRRSVRLHDVGKIAVPDSILRKPGRLTPEEYAVIREHTTTGGRILQGSRFPVLISAEEIARFHHERWDGGGYPTGLKEEEIPLSARIAAVADVFDALTHSRPYKEAWCVEAAVQEIRRQAGAQFDPRVVEAFEKVVKAQALADPPPMGLRRAA